MRAYFEDTIETIQKSLESLDETQFSLLLEQCVQSIQKNGKIIASGLGKNVPICEKFVGTLNSLGIQAAFLHTNTAMHGDLGIVKENDILLLLSKSGDTTESIELARHLLERRTNMWLISFETNSDLYRMINSKIILRLEKEGDRWDMVPNNSTSVYLILLQGLAMHLADRLGVTLLDFKQNHPGGKIGEFLKEV